MTIVWGIFSYHYWHAVSRISHSRCFATYGFSVITAFAVSPIPELAVVPQPGNLGGVLTAGSVQEAEPIPFMLATSSSTPTPVGEGPVAMSLFAAHANAQALASHPLAMPTAMSPAPGHGAHAHIAAWDIDDISDMSDDPPLPDPATQSLATIAQWHREHPQDPQAHASRAQLHPPAHVAVDPAVGGDVRQRDMEARRNHPRVRRAQSRVVAAFRARDAATVWSMEAQVAQAQDLMEDAIADR